MVSCLLLRRSALIAGFFLTWSELLFRYVCNATWINVTMNFASHNLTGCFKRFFFLYKICVHSFCRRKLYICYCHIPGSLGYLIFQDCLILTHLVLLLMDIKYELIQVLQTCHEASCQKIFLAEGSGLFFKNK